MDCLPYELFVAFAAKDDQTQRGMQPLDPSIPYHFHLHAGNDLSDPELRSKMANTI